MQPDFRGDADHHDGTSDATPGGYEGRRRPGELIFAFVMVGLSAVLLHQAHDISGFEAFSAPGTVPMVATGAMLGAALIVLLETLRKSPIETETLSRDILPPVVVVLTLALIAIGFLLEPLGFLPATALFLTGAMKLLSGRSWLRSAAVALGALAVIWLVFRMVFAVLLPEGIVPEAEIVQALRDLFGGDA